MTQIPMVYFNPFQRLVTTISCHKVSKGDNFLHNSENGRFVYYYFIYPMHSMSNRKHSVQINENFIKEMKENLI